ncbi:DeoR/GlpR family DNA-binding transcription regulator [Sphaerochaeta sp. PS]|uniref:DeoR/GlpR family DNA-binding transcription regulator n=1 Tax=Sphaerochaeta sp. PS TaxID=3076336 RepID=UPI0028A4A9C7|nr:DeoR/GlpR family DNA-binding transcription regulator [Sphaerochaeta sp. PS]MDT4762304.1 DeoR/GlpR family DNA-binding transcription regulator [Sphaerochaeta sp. PS]
MNTLNNRQQKEVDIINNLHFITIKDLANTLNVSEMTVRRDCTLLASRGLIKQVFGGVTSHIPEKLLNYTVDSELKKNMIIKEKIASKAISLLKPNEVFFLDSGTTAATIARLLPRESSYTIISPSFLAIELLVKLDQSSVICPGGIYLNKPRVFYNQESADFLQHFRAGKCFIGATAFDINHGITCGYFEDVPLKQAMLDCSQERILITDSSKFDKVSTCVFTNITTLTAIITDDGISQVYKDFITSNGVKLYIV